LFPFFIKWWGRRKVSENFLKFCSGFYILHILSSFRYFVAYESLKSTLPVEPLEMATPFLLLFLIAIIVAQAAISINFIAPSLNISQNPTFTPVEDKKDKNYLDKITLEKSASAEDDAAKTIRNPRNFSKENSQHIRQSSPAPSQNRFSKHSKMLSTGSIRFEGSDVENNEDSYESSNEEEISLVDEVDLAEKKKKKKILKSVASSVVSKGDFDDNYNDIEYDDFEEYEEYSDELTGSPADTNSPNINIQKKRI